MAIYCSDQCRTGDCGECEPVELDLFLAGRDPGPPCGHACHDWPDVPLAGENDPYDWQ